MNNIIECRSLCFSYIEGDNQTSILSNLMLEVKSGESIAILGPSGCGKSTVARLILGLYKPTAGSIKYDGVEIGPIQAAKSPERMQPRMQMIFQDPFASLNPRWRVSEIVAEPIHVRGFSNNKLEVKIIFKK